MVDCYKCYLVVSVTVSVMRVLYDYLSCFCKCLGFSMYTVRIRLSALEMFIVVMIINIIIIVIIIIVLLLCLTVTNNTTTNIIIMKLSK